MSIFPRILLIPILALGLGGCAVSSREPGNLSVAKEEIKAYIESKDYDRDLAATAAKAKTWVEKRTAKTGEKLAIVFDIDETVLSNLSHMREEDWGYQPKIWDAWVAESTAPAIDPVRQVYQTAIAKNVTVFFITGRRDREKSATARNLKAQGMGRYAELIVKPDSFPYSRPASQFKAPQRQRITGQGYTIIANIGDQMSDLEGGYSERTFKLPNPFYRIK